MRRSQAPWVLVAIGAIVTFPLVWLAARNGSFSRDGAFVFLALVVLSGWTTVGAILASRNPSNPIGWLMMAFGLGFLVVGLSSEWSTYAFVTDPGGLPFGTFWLWLSSWWFLAFITAIPALLVLYPTGRVHSPRWRYLIWALIGTTTLATVASMFRAIPLEPEFGEAVRIPNPVGLESIDGILQAAQTAAGVAFVVALIPLSVAALIVRFRHAREEERQQIRWFLYVTAIGAIAFVLAVVSGLSLQTGEVSLINEVSFYAFFVTTGLGMPAAIGIALLRYRLWDLDIVLKKTLVATAVVVLATIASVVVLLIVAAVAVGPVADEPGALLLAGAVVGGLVWPILRLSRRIADRIVYGGRATPYEVLTEFSERMAETYSTEDVLPRMAAILGEGSGAEAVTIWLLVGGELRPAAGWPKVARPDELRPMPALIDADPNAFEVRHQGEALGAITVRMPANDPMDPSKARLIRDLASQAGLVLRNVRLIEELRESRRRIVAAVDEGRRRLERNIHDGAQQQLVALAVKLRLADGLVERDPARARQLISELQGETTDALENLRDLARGIYPPLLADEGLTAALEAQTRKSPVPVRIHVNGVGRYPQEVEATVYFCVLEALNNVAKYGNAGNVDVALRREDGRLAFEVRDDGVGFDPGAVAGGTGLQGMADRVEALGGTLEVESAPGRGTVVTGRLPIG